MWVQNRLRRAEKSASRSPGRETIVMQTYWSKTALPRDGRDRPEAAPGKDDLPLLYRTGKYWGTEKSRRGRSREERPRGTFRRQRTKRRGYFFSGLRSMTRKNTSAPSDWNRI